MNDQLAASLLWEVFYEFVESKVFPGEYIPMFRRDDGALVLPNQASPEELQARRDRLLGSDFRFKIPSRVAPKGLLVDVTYADGFKFHLYKSGMADVVVASDGSKWCQRCQEYIPMDQFDWECLGTFSVAECSTGRTPSGTR